MPSDNELVEYSEDGMSIDVRITVSKISGEGRSEYYVSELGDEFLEGWKNSVDTFCEQIKHKLYWP